MQDNDITSNADEPRAALRRNVELKARLHSTHGAREVAERLATDQLGMHEQVDTYFHSPHGRLKLREIDGTSAQLIWYARPDRPEARTCEYYLLDIPEPQRTKELLVAALGIRKIVVKRREIFLVENVRIHLDEVEGLGTFLEFEAVMGPAEDLRKGHQQLASLLEQFSIRPEDILSGSYGDMDA